MSKLECQTKMAALGIYKAKFEKRPLSFMSEIGIFDIFFKRLYEETFEDLTINRAIENFKPAPLCPIKWWFSKCLRNYTKVLF